MYLARFRVTVICLVTSCVAVPTFLAAQSLPPAGQAVVMSKQVPAVLTLEDVVALAESRSENVAIAETGVQRAQGGEIRARSEWRPQLGGTASYDRALASEFEGIFNSDVGGPPCTPLQLNPGAPLTDRVAELERAYDCPSSSSSSDPFGGAGDTLPFGRANTYRLSLSLSQNVFAGGRLTAQLAQARLTGANARLSVTSSRAQATLDAVSAFYDTGLSDQVLESARAALDQAERSLAYTRAQREAGRVSEFDLLRAQVAFDSLRPDVIRSEAARDVAGLRLKQLLDLPLDADVQLATDLGSESLPVPARFAEAVATSDAVPQEDRVALLQASNEVLAREADIDVARAQRRPAVALNSAYGLVAYPTVVPAFGDFRTNWTVGASVQVPVLTGGRLRADELIARAGLEESRLRLRLTREIVALDLASARQEMRSAGAAWEVTAGTIRQAARAYEIADIRFTEGISTQLELNDARLLLLQARVNQAVAARDLQVTRARFALLPNLPLGASPTSAAGTAATFAAQGNGTSTSSGSSAGSGSQGTLRQTTSAPGGSSR